MKKKSFSSLSLSLLFHVFLSCNQLFCNSTIPLATFSTRGKHSVGSTFAIRCSWYTRTSSILPPLSDLNQSLRSLIHSQEFMHINLPYVLHTKGLSLSLSHRTWILFNQGTFSRDKQNRQQEKRESQTGNNKRGKNRKQIHQTS